MKYGKRECSILKYVRAITKTSSVGDFSVFFLLSVKGMTK